MSPQKQSRAPRRKPGLSDAELAKRHAFIIRLVDEENATLSELINVLGLASPAEARRALKAARQWKQAQDSNFKPARPAKIELTPPTPEEVARLADTEGCSFYEIARRHRMDAHHVQQLYVRFLEQETTVAVVQDAQIAQAAAAWEELGPAALNAVKAKRPSAARARGKAVVEPDAASAPDPAAAEQDKAPPPTAATPGVSSRRTRAKPAGSQKPGTPARGKSR